jgi:hypothetical protein
VAGAAAIEAKDEFVEPRVWLRRPEARVGLHVLRAQDVINAEAIVESRTWPDKVFVFLLYTRRRRLSPHLVRPERKA